MPEDMSDGGHDDRSRDLVWLAECLNLADAEELARHLEMEDIPFFLNNQNMAAIFPGMPGGVSGFGLGKVVIMVPASELERAQAIVRAARGVDES